MLGSVTVSPARRRCGLYAEFLPGRSVTADDVIAHFRRLRRTFRTPLVILTHLGVDEQNRCRNQEHEAIVDAIARRDTRTAKKVMNQHLLHIESKIKHKPEKPPADLATLLRPQKVGEPA